MLSNDKARPCRLAWCAFGVVALCFVAPRPSVGQRVARPDTVKAKTEPAPAPSRTGPMAGQMTEAMMEGMLRVMARPESAERLANFTRHYYDALVRKGFSREEALQIVVAAGLHRLSNWTR